MPGEPVRPLFERRTATPPARGRLLLISYHFPPAETAGAVRWQQFAVHAARHGWALDVITRAPASLDAERCDGLSRLPEGIRVFGVPDRAPWLERAEQRILEAHRLFWHPQPRIEPVGGWQSPSSFARSEIRFEPWSPSSWRCAHSAGSSISRERAWANDAYALGRAIGAAGAPRLVVSCGPPHWADHEAARRLAREAGVSLVLDLRDPWSLVERLVSSLASPLWLRTAARCEARAVRQAALVVMNTEAARDAMRRRYPAWAERIEAVLNGVDDDRPPRAAEKRARRFLIAYAGTVYLDRNPRSLFRAAAKLVAELGVDARSFGIEFMGEAPPGFVEAIAEQEGVAGYVRVHPPGPRQAAAAFLERASVLLNLPQDSHLAIPSKIFEYMRHDAAILALAAPASATAGLLQGTDADVVFPDDVDAIAGVLRARYRDFRAGRRPRPLAALARFSRGAQADRLFHAIARIVEGTR